MARQQEPDAGMYAYSGAYDPAKGKMLGSPTKFSVGIFRWVPTADGKRLKKSAVVERIRGYASDPEDVYRRAQERCDRLNGLNVRRTSNIAEQDGMAYLEEYQRCGCTNIEFSRDDLLGYCPRHGTDRKYAKRIPVKKGDALGYCEA